MKKILSLALMAAIILSGCAGENTGITTTSEITTTVSETEPVTTTVVTTTKETTTTTKATTTKAVTTTTLNEKTIRENKAVALYEKMKKQNIPEFELDEKAGDDVIGIFQEKEFRIKKEPSIDGDKYFFGVFNTKADEWEIPLNYKAKIVTELPTDILEEIVNGNEPINKIDNVLTIRADRISYWCYDYINDEFVKVIGEPKFVKNGKMITLETFKWGLNSILRAYDFKTGEFNELIEAVDIEVAEYYYNISSIALYEEVFLAKREDNRWVLSDYNGEIILELPEYKYISSASDYNEKLLVFTEGKDSGYYICLIDCDGEFVAEPVKYNEDIWNLGKFDLILFDDFYVVVREDEYEKTIATFYEFDGSYIAKRIY